jgi:hypothetical protein
MLRRYTRPYWLTLGLEPFSSRSQQDVLPVKLKPTYVVGAGFEPTSSDSNAEMLTIALSNNFMAVRKGVEPFTTDRQSVILPLHQ